MPKHRLQSLTLSHVLRIHLPATPHNRALILIVHILATSLRLLTGLAGLSLRLPLAAGILNERRDVLENEVRKLAVHDRVGARARVLVARADIVDEVDVSFGVEEGASFGLGLRKGRKIGGGGVGGVGD